MTPRELDDLDWLVGCPAGDINFRLALNRASIEVLERAREEPHLTKTARRAIQARLNRRQQQANRALTMARKEAV